MSQLLIQHYLNDLSDLRRISGEARESVVREAFKTLLKDWGRSRDLIFIPEYKIDIATKERRYVDGALLHQLRVPFGYWEAKDEADNLDEEIEKKFRRGYPQDNIIFEDSHNAVLIQNKQEVVRCGVDDPAKLKSLLDLFFGYERKEIADFRKAVEQFKTDLPAVLGSLRDMIAKAEKDNAAFAKAALKFLKHAQDTINPSVTAADVREMLIQHILTEEIFSQVFDNADFHRQNNVAKELYALENTFFTGKVKHDTLAGLRSYYAAIKSAAALVSNHQEKQTFLKTIYENFYKVYDKKKADRLGVVYTPNEIVRFMIESADWLCQKHFGKALIDKNVEILDPAAGTGTFISELIEHFRGQPQKLRYKYLEELHANEVAILPYYVANLNIEATYAAINGYEEFPNLCFVDTLDNTAALRAHKGQQGDLFGGVSEENVARIKRQNKKKISVIIGNPPYNANQLNENENNKNREYPEIDNRIRETYIAASAAHKTKLYDMYARFFRWASDRIDNNGIIAFVSNSSFIDSRTYDGFRKIVSREFNEIWIVNLKGNARTSGDRRRREAGNVFDDQIRVGIAVYFCIKNAKLDGCRIRYESVEDYASSDEKREFLAANRISSRTFDEIEPDKKFNWITEDDNDFASLFPMAAPKLSGKSTAIEAEPIFNDLSFGTVSNRDDWVYDFDRGRLVEKIGFYIGVYDDALKSLSYPLRKGWEEDLDYRIKWTQNLRRFAASRTKIKLDEGRIISALYRPYCKKFYCYDEHLNWSLYRMRHFYPNKGSENVTIFFSDRGARAPFSVLATNVPAELHLCASSDGFQSVARYRFDKDGSRHDSLSDASLVAIRSHYGNNNGAGEKSVTKDAVFHYVYGVLHDPIYREKYALKLAREFPRIPFYVDFWRWADWGEKLMALHVGYETVEQWPLDRLDAADEKSVKAGLSPKPMLRADHDNGIIVLDSETQLSGVPKEAWSYRLGNRSALDWILDQHKEKTPKDPTIREKFNTYRFADHKEKVIDLLKRVTRVSVETMAIIEEMKQAKR